MFCQAALRSILCLDRLATAEACIRLEPNNVSVDIGSGLQKFIIIIIISMPSVAIQTRLSQDRHASQNNVKAHGLIGSMPVTNRAIAVAEWSGATSNRDDGVRM